MSGNRKSAISMPGFRLPDFRTKAGQAKRKPTRAGRPVLKWHKSWNWLLLLLPVIGGTVYLSYQDTMLPIRMIRLSSSFQHLDQAVVESAVSPFMGEGFLSLDINGLKKTLSHEPWVESISIRRVWPDRLDIAITEKTPVALWDENNLLSDKAIVFAAKTARFSTLPQVHTAGNNAAQILGHYYQLAGQFAALNERVMALREDSRGALDIQLQNGLKIKLGRSDIEQKIARMMLVYQTQIQPRKAQIEQLDLRYSNGFVVAWKKELIKGRSAASLWRKDNV